MLGLVRGFEIAFTQRTLTLRRFKQKQPLRRFARLKWRVTPRAGSVKSRNETLKSDIHSATFCSEQTIETILQQKKCANVSFVAHVGQKNPKDQ